MVDWSLCGGLASKHVCPARDLAEGSPALHLLAEAAGHALTLHLRGGGMRAADAVALQGCEGAGGTRQNGRAQWICQDIWGGEAGCRMFHSMQLGEGVWEWGTRPEHECRTRVWPWSGDGACPLDAGTQVCRRGFVGPEPTTPKAPTLKNAGES